MTSPLLFIDWVFLQVTGNPITDFLNKIFSPQSLPSSQTGSILITPDYAPLITAFVVLFFFIIAVRYVINSRKHPNSESPVGIVEFIIMGQGRMDGFVSNYTAHFRPSIVRALKANERFKNAVDELLELRESGILYFYQMYYRSVKDMLTSTIRRRRNPVLVISTASLDDQKIAFSQSEPRFSWVSLGWDYVKTTVCHSSSERIQVDSDEGEMDVWIIAPIPDIHEETKYERTKSEEKVSKGIPVWRKDLDANTLEMNITVLPYSEELAKIASAMVQASKQVDYIEGQDETINALEESVKDRDKKVNRLRQKVNMLLLLVGQKKLIGTDLPAGIFRPKDILQWIVLGALGGLLMGELPRVVPQLAGVDRLFMGIIGTVIVIAIYMMTRKSNKAQMDELMEEEGLPTGQIG